MRSLKRTLIVWTAAAAIVLAAVAGLTLYALAETYLVDQFDAALARKARVFASTIELEVASLELGFEDLDMGEFASADAGGYLQVYYEDASIHRSPSLADHDLPIDAVSNDPGAINPVALPNGRHGRGVAYRFTPATDVLDPEDLEDLEDLIEPDPQPATVNKAQVSVTLCLARDTAEIDAALGALQIALASIGLALAALLAIVIAAAIGRGLRPVGSLAKKMGTVDERSLDQHLDPDGVPRELSPIVEQFNAMLQRLRIAFDRERRFSADMAHELRTPLSGLRMTIDVARSKPRDIAEHERCLDQLLEVTKQMQVLVDGLLQLAMLETGAVNPRFEPTVIDDEIQRAWDAELNNGAVAKEFTPTLSLDASNPIPTDPSLLAVVLRNVLHNALAYVDPGGTIDIASTADDRGVRITIANSGSQVADHEADHVFDRFWRADQARAETGSRFGLGLSLTRLAAQAIGGSVTATSQRAGRFVITLNLPL